MAKVHPSTFLRAVLVKPISLSQKLPYQGARLGINLHMTPFLCRLSVSRDELNSHCNSSTADM